MPLTKADQIWNRAAVDGGGSNPNRGDIELSALLLLHGLVMNGGVEHAMECLSTNEQAAAITGFRYFGFTELASILQSARHANEDELEAIDRRYWEQIPSDDTIVQAFDCHFCDSPESFAPLK